MAHRLPVLDYSWNSWISLHRKSGMKKFLFLMLLSYGSQAGTSYFNLASGRTIAVITPVAFKPSGKCVVHFHGLRIASWDKTKKGTIDHFGFEKLLPADMFLIAPIANDGVYDLPKAYGSGFQDTLKAVAKATGISCSKITTSFHSAGGRVALLLAQNAPKTFERMVLLDATYSSNIQPFTAWLVGDASRKLYAASRKNDGVFAHASAIKGKNFTNVLSETSNHWDVVNRYLPQGLK